MIQERRQSQRVGIDIPMRVVLGEARDGFVLDVCENGLAVCAPKAGSPGDALPFALDLPEGSGRVEGRAEIVWKSASGYRTGLHFLDITEPGRERLTNWISTRAWTLRADGVENEYRLPREVIHASEVSHAAEVSAHPVAPAGPQESEQIGRTTAPVAPLGVFGAEFESARLPLVTPEMSTDGWRPISVIGLVLGALLLFAGLGFLVSSSHSLRSKLQVKDSVAAAAPSPALPLKDVAPAIAPSTTPKTAPSPTFAESSAPPPKLSNGGFVLQVGAMTHEAYADALVSDLKQKHLPAFVFRREGDNFYRVAVGPFSATESSAAVKGQLEQQGLKPFVRPWSPEER